MTIFCFFLLLFLTNELIFLVEKNILLKWVERKRVLIYNGDEKHCTPADPIRYRMHRVVQVRINFERRYVARKLGHQKQCQHLIDVPLSEPI